MSIERVYLEFDCKCVNWSLPSNNLWHPILPNVSSHLSRGNLWHPVQAGVCTPGGISWHAIGKHEYTYLYISRHPMARQYE